MGARQVTAAETNQQKEYSRQSIRHCKPLPLSLSHSLAQAGGAIIRDEVAELTRTPCSLLSDKASPSTSPCCPCSSRKRKLQTREQAVSRVQVRGGRRRLTTQILRGGGSEAKGFGKDLKCRDPRRRTVRALTFLLESIQGAVKDVMKLDGVLLHAGHDIVASVRLYEQGIVLRERRMGQRRRIERG